MVDLQCVILVGGLGTRLGLLTRDCPKPMLPVAGRPFLCQLIDNAARFGFSRFLLLAGYLSEAVRAEFPHGVFQTPGGVVSVDVLTEPEPLGTGGALRFAGDRLAPEFLMMNGDSFFDFNWLALCAPLQRSVGRLALRRVKDASRYGLVTRDGERATAIWERPEQSGPGEINGGVYWLSRKILDFVGCEGAVSLERDVFPRAIAQGRLEALLEAGPFVDIGVPVDYEAACARGKRRRGAVFFDYNVLTLDRDYGSDTVASAWRPGGREAIRLVNARGLFAFVVADPSPIARGLCKEEDMRLLRVHMQADLRAIGAHVDDFRYCLPRSNGAGAAHSGACGCGKPKSDIILDLLAHWPVDDARSLVVVDAANDLKAGAAAGLRRLRIDEAVPLDGTLAAAL